MRDMVVALSLIFGAIVGSFLNVVALRYNTGRSLAGRSQCPSCAQVLAARDLIPLVSFVALGARCRFCGARLSLQYPLVEGATALIFAALALTAANAFAFIVGAALASLLVVVVLYDLHHRVIPDLLVFLLFLLALLNALFIGAFPENLFFGLLAALPFAFLSLVSSGLWMGWGDAKLAFALGVFLTASEVLTFVLFSFWIGALVSLSLLCAQRLLSREGPPSLTLKSEIPFAPFMAAGFLIVHLFPVDIVLLLSL